MNLLFKGREWYREMKEQDHEHSEDTTEPEVDGDPGICPNCKHDDICQGGCNSRSGCGYKFEKREDENA